MQAARRARRRQTVAPRPFSLPRFYDWGGGPGVPISWSFGWYIPEIDLVCATWSPADDQEGELALCPVCRNRPLAVLALLAKALLLRIDTNLRR